MAGLKRSSSRLGRLFMVPVSVISLWHTTRKEGTRQRWKDCGEERKCVFLFDGTYIKWRLRGGNEKAWGTAERRHKDCSIGPVREREKIWPCISLRSWNQRLGVFLLCVCVSLQCARWSLESAASRCWVTGVLELMTKRRSMDTTNKDGRAEDYKL